jgi:hypothetical protein
MNEISPGYKLLERFRGYRATDEIIEAMTTALHRQPG